MTALTLPSIKALADAAAILVQAAHNAEDRAAENALNKAMWHLHQGVEIIPTTGGFLVPSGTREGTIHRISNTHGCSCEAGSKGRTCWHMSALEIVEAARIHYVDYETAITEMDELFA